MNGIKRLVRHTQITGTYFAACNYIRFILYNVASSELNVDYSLPDIRSVFSEKVWLSIAVFV